MTTPIHPRRQRLLTIARWTRHDNRFDQVGFGVEFLSQRIDARAQLLPDRRRRGADPLARGCQRDEAARSTKTGEWSDIFGEGHALKQTRAVATRTRITTTRTMFAQYEAALEGWDAEIGYKLPYIDELAETRLFVGYQDFENPFEGDRYGGFKGRLEVRANPGLTLDAELFEDQHLNGTDYFVGARMHVPFDLANLSEGKSPFAGMSRTSSAASPLPSRNVSRRWSSAIPASTPWSRS